MWDYICRRDPGNGLSDDACATHPPVGHSWAVQAATGDLHRRECVMVPDSGLANDRAVDVCGTPGRCPTSPRHWLTK
jgi:hypothetical protein